MQTFWCANYTVINITNIKEPKSFLPGVHLIASKNKFFPTVNTIEEVKKLLPADIQGNKDYRFFETPYEISLEDFKELTKPP